MNSSRLPWIAGAGAVGLGLVALVVVILAAPAQAPSTPAAATPTVPATPATPQPPAPAPSAPPQESTPTTTPDQSIVAPISNALSRVTKKTFGLQVSPGHSPVSPERFSGYHTGVDFETTPDEQQTDVAINTICAGPLVLKKYASGYGGVAVQRCTINGATVTVIYGHLRLASIKPAVNDDLAAGAPLAVLGTGYSTETDSERKHLHLGIHKGAAINIAGYVQNSKDLSGWLDALPLLQAAAH